jgi:hypothetical protein
MARVLATDVDLNYPDVFYFAFIFLTALCNPSFWSDFYG